ncbi:F-box protein At1g30790-like [Triticum aestivum]|uniref:F-box protein At1g30790-like n=1 Tax=Triticum aestivum TaxID=4565 RepID=UPI001D00EF85|nr:F-box protein At1g30790-like [Triticum aestivum]
MPSTVPSFELTRNKPAWPAPPQLAPVRGRRGCCSCPRRPGAAAARARAGPARLLPMRTSASTTSSSGLTRSMPAWPTRLLLAPDAAAAPAHVGLHRSELTRRMPAGPAPAPLPPMRGWCRCCSSRVRRRPGRRPQAAPPLRSTMERTTADTRSVRRHLSSPGVTLPDDLIVGEILVRLPAKSLFRFRAACRSWCSRTSTHQFISSFGRKLPLVGLYSNPLKSLHDKSGLESVDVLAAANNLRSVLTFDCYSNWLCASLDGLLLVSYGNGRHTICNPATRQSIPLPQLTGGVVAGLYSSPTADRGVEYRTLFSKGRLPMCNPKYYILTVGSPMEPRPVQLPEEPDNLKIALLHGINDPTPSLCHRPTVMLNSCLHWVPESCRHDKVVVFDTVAESFRSIQSPTAAQENTRLFEMGSQLGFSLYNGTSDTRF